MRENVISV